MSEIPQTTQPRQEELSYDLKRALSAIVSVRTQIPETAMTAGILGTERVGHGVLIRENGLIVTIGYLVTEAETIWLIDNNGDATNAHTIAYDQETGFGLIQALGRLDLPPLEMGNSADVNEGESVAHPSWSGAGLIGHDGTLRGIGSLFVQQAISSDNSVNCNMVVPIDILKPIMDELLTYGRVQKPARPWLGMMTTELDDALVVAGVTEGGPAQRADVRVGDFILGVGGQSVKELAEMFRRVWATGEAGVGIPLTLSRDGEILDLTVQSVNRSDSLNSPQLH